MLKDASRHGAVLWVSPATTLWVAGALWKEADPAIQGQGVLAYGLAQRRPTVVEFWIAVAETPRRSAPIYTYSSDGGVNAQAEILLRPDGFVEALDRHGRTQLMAVSPDAVDDGDWHYVVVDFAHEVVSVDGGGYNDVAPAPAVPEPWSPRACLRRCSRRVQRFGGQGFSGSLDEIALYDHSFSYGRLAAHMSSGGDSPGPASHNQFDGTVPEKKRPPAAAIPVTPLGPATPGTYRTKVVGPTYPRPLRAVVSTTPDTYSLTGRILNMTTAIAIAGARVRLGPDCLNCATPEPTLETRTSPTGAFAFTAIRAPSRLGPQLLSVYAPGYGSLAFAVWTRARHAFTVTLLVGFGGGWREEATIPTRSDRHPRPFADQLGLRLYPPR